MPAVLNVLDKAADVIPYGPSSPLAELLRWDHLVELRYVGNSGQDQPLHEPTDVTREGHLVVAGHALLVLPGLRNGGGASPFTRDFSLKL